MTFLNVWHSLLHWGTRTLQRIFGSLCTNSFQLCIGYGTIKIKLKARTSSTAFVVGIGSFMAYKLFCRMARSNCLWTTLDQLVQQRTLATMDSPSSTSPSRTVELTEGFYAVRLGGENELLRKLDECLCRKGSASTDVAGTARQDEKVAVVQVRHGSTLRRLIRQNKRVQREGIEALQQEQNATEGILMRGERRHKQKRDDDEESMISGISNLTSASRIKPNPHAVERVPPLQLPQEGESAAVTAASSAVSTPMSALLHCPNADEELCWENEFSSASEAGDVADARQTDDEMGEPEGLFLFRERCNSLGSISQLSAMKNLERMFRGMPDWNAESNIDECHVGTQLQQQHQLVDTALDNLRDLDRLESSTNVSSSMASGRLARRCWLEMEDGTNRPAAAAFPREAYKIVGPKLVEMKRLIAAERGRKQHFSACRSQGLWELCGADVGRRNSSRFSSEKITMRAGGDDGTEQYQKHQQQLLTPMSSTGISSSTMVDSVISCHSSLASTSAFSTRQRSCTDDGGGDAGVMFDSAIVSDSAQSNLGLGDGIEHENEDDFDGLSRLAKDGVIRRFCPPNAAAQIKASSSSNTTTPAWFVCPWLGEQPRVVLLIRGLIASGMAPKTPRSCGELDLAITTADLAINRIDAFDQSVLAKADVETLCAIERVFLLDATNVARAAQSNHMLDDVITHLPKSRAGLPGSLNKISQVAPVYSGLQMHAEQFFGFWKPLSPHCVGVAQASSTDI
uniref:Uncharacterized protein n=1 Tax=Globodera pallida TaxID=36090 RepID=A0A183BN64_GLOPA